MPTVVGEPGTVTVDSSLPTALPLPDGIWAQTGPGWVLATYQPSVVTYPGDGGSPTVETTHQVIYLVNPDGTRYQVLELDSSAPIEIESWFAEDSHALVRSRPFSYGQGVGDLFTLNLTTGTTIPFPVPFNVDSLYFVRALSDSVRIWHTHSGFFIERGGVFQESATTNYRISPDGSQVAMRLEGTKNVLEVISIATGGVLNVPWADIFPEYTTCSVNDWSADDRVLVDCFLDPDQPHLFLVDPLTGVATETFPSNEGDPCIQHDFRVAPHLLAGILGFRLGGGCDYDASQGVGIETDGSVSALTILDSFGTPFDEIWITGESQGLLYVVGVIWGGNQEDPETLVTYNPLNRDQVVLLPEPPGGVTTRAAPSSSVVTMGLTSWAIAP